MHNSTAIAGNIRSNILQKSQRECPDTVATTFCHHQLSVSFLAFRMLIHTLRWVHVPTTPSKDPVLRPPVPHWKKGLNCCLRIAYFISTRLADLICYEAIESGIIPGSFSYLLCITNEQLVTIYKVCGVYNMRRDCFFWHNFLRFYGSISKCSREH